MAAPIANTVDLEATCIMCPRNGKLVCPDCKSARYCSKDCFKLDWKNNKIFCAVFINDKRPEKKYRRALFFPGGESPPRFQWVELYIRRDQHGEDFFASAEFGNEDKDIGSTNFNHIQGRSLARVPGEALHWHKIVKPLAVPDTDPANVGLRTFTRSGACWEEFRGPVFVLRAMTNEKGRMRYLDMTMRDVRAAADLLSQTGRDGYDQKHLRDVKVLGTIVRAAEELPGGAKEWDEVVLNGRDKVWASEGSGIANLLGLPLLCRSTAFIPYQEPDPALCNEVISLLYRDVVSSCVLAFIERPKSILLEFETVPGRPSESTEKKLTPNRRLNMGARDTTGDAYLVRTDGKPFPPQHDEALCGFVREKVEPLLSAAISGLGEAVPVPGREDVLSFISRNNFETYYNEFKAAKIEAGEDSWTGLPSPYEIRSSDMRSGVREVWAAQNDAGFEQSSEKFARQEHGHFTAADWEEGLKALGCEMSLLPQSLQSAFRN